MFVLSIHWILFWMYDTVFDFLRVFANNIHFPIWIRVKTLFCFSFDLFIMPNERRLVAESSVWVNKKLLGGTRHEKTNLYACHQKAIELASYCQQPIVMLFAPFSLSLSSLSLFLLWAACQQQGIFYVSTYNQLWIVVFFFVANAQCNGKIKNGT